MRGSDDFPWRCGSNAPAWCVSTTPRDAKHHAACPGGAEAGRAKRARWQRRSRCTRSRIAAGRRAGYSRLERRVRPPRSGYSRDQLGEHGGEPGSGPLAGMPARGGTPPRVPDTARAAARRQADAAAVRAESPRRGGLACEAPVLGCNFAQPVRAQGRDARSRLARGQPTLHGVRGRPEPPAGREWDGYSRPRPDGECSDRSGPQGQRPSGPRRETCRRRAGSEATRGSVGDVGKVKLPSTRPAVAQRFNRSCPAVRENLPCRR